MPRIRCHYAGCVFLEQGYCSAAAAEIDPDEGCLTYSPEGEVPVEQAWQENERMEEDWAEAGFGSADSEDDLWLESETDEDMPEDFDFDD